MYGTTAGYLQIKEAFPTNSIASPKGLRYAFRRPEAEVYTNTLGLFQIKAPETFVNVATNSDTKYFIQLFSFTNVLAFTNGGYQLTNSPYRTITVENPGGDTNLVRITDSNGGAVYDYSAQSNGWLLVTGNGLRHELKTSVYSETNTVRTTTTSISDGTNAPVLTKVETFRTYSYGERLIQEVIGSGDVAKTNTYAYTTNGYLQLSIHDDGFWEYHIYDTNNRPIKIYSAFLNQDVTTNAALCRLIEHDYSTNVVSGSGDTGKLYFNTPRRTIEYLQSNEIRRSYFLGFNDARVEIQCASPGAAWNDAANLVTTNRLFTSGFHLNEPSSILQPDGTVEIYQYGYIGDFTTNIVLHGHPSDAYYTNIDDGTKVISILGTLGQVLTNFVVDVASGLTLSREVFQYDALNRRTNTIYLDGTANTLTYSCCTLDSEKARDGTMTTYGYDALKRRITTTRNSITISNVYDPAGNILRTVRYGTDASAITTSQTVFNTAGEIIAMTNALNSPTLYTNWMDGSGQLVKQTTYADGGTRVETYHRDGRLQSVAGTAVAPVRFLYGVASDGGVARAYRAEIKLDAAFADTSETVTNFVDMLGRNYKAAYSAASGSPFAISHWNTKGQLTNTVDPDGVLQLYGYNSKAELSYLITDSNRDYTVDWSGGDRISYVTNDVYNNGIADVRRSRTYLWSTNGSGVSNLASTVEVSTDGLRSWSTIWNNGTAITSQSRVVFDAANGYRYVTNIAPDNSYTVAITRYGTNVSQTAFGSLNNQLSSINYSYDAHGRPNAVTDARTGTTSYTFNDADQVVTVTTPDPDGGGPGSAQTTTMAYDNMGRVWKTTLPDTTSVTNEYYLTGLLKKTYGSRTYPVEYTYDAQGRMKTMKTWQDFAGNNGTATTTWNYDLYRGWLTNKTYDGGAAGPVYTYTAAGRLKSRTWARTVGGQPLATTNLYNNAGDLSTTFYTDSTPGVTNAFDRLGRTTGVTNGANVCAFTYNDAGLLLSERYTAGALSGLGVTNAYDHLLRRTNVSTLASSTGYSYDYASRLAQVVSGTNTARYTYLANSPLVSQIAFTNGSALRMTTTKQYDFLNRLTGISSINSQPTTINSLSYAYNLANQRTSVTNHESARWVYTYDSLGQVTSGKKYWSDGTPVAGQQFEYAFDDIGNRKTIATGGDEFGANLRSASYGANLLNQYTNRTVPGYVDIMGSATNTATVTVNNQPTYRHGDYFRAELTADNSAAALWFGVTNVAVLNNGTNADIVASVTGNVLVAKSPEAFTFDADGNQTSDGLWTNTWNGENRLLSTESTAGVPTAGKRRVDYTYDCSGRMIQRIAFTNSGTSYFAVETNRFVYDGVVQLAELDGGNSLVKSYVRGLDLSGTMQGAGGVGGLLAINAGTNGVHFYCHDGNGNVMALINASNGVSSADFDYTPFGVVLRATGPMASVGTFGFSSQYRDFVTGRILYLYRSYNPEAGGWESRDPIAESGGPNLYGFVGNQAISRTDMLGLADFRNHWNIGMAAMQQLGIKMGWKEAECLRRGLISPDLPFLDTGGVASKLGVVPIAGGFHLKSQLSYYKDLVTEPVMEFADNLKQRYRYLDIDDPWDWAALAARPITDAAAKYGRRVEYWWDDSSFAGPILMKVPFVNRAKTIRTHYGDLAYNHAMGTTGMSAEIVQQNIIQAVNQLLANFRAKQNSDCCRAYMELGMAIHTLTDSWAAGHTTRNANGSIALFQDYNEQSLHFHEAQDQLADASSFNYLSAVSQSAQMIGQAMGNSPIDSVGFFPLAPGAQVGVLRQNRRIGFWEAWRNGYPGER